MSEQNIGKVFIVEDNELNLKLFTDLLKSNDYEVAFTRDGEGAVELMRKFMPNLILMDIQLQGISGLDIIKRIKEDKHIRHVPIIAVTAFAMKDDREKIMASGCEGYIAKPISIEPFLQIVAQYIKK